MQMSNPFLQSQGCLHGGMTATLLDVACGYAGLHTGEVNVEMSGVTVMLNISYLNFVRGGAVIAKGVCSRKGRRIYFSEATLSSEDGELLATAHGCFKQNAGHETGSYSAA